MFTRIKEGVYASKKRIGRRAKVSLVKHGGDGWVIHVFECPRVPANRAACCANAAQCEWDCRGRYATLSAPKGSNPADWKLADDGNGNKVWLCRRLDLAKRYAAPYLVD